MSNIINFFKNLNSINNFKKHNRKIFKKKKFDTKSEILIEFNAFQTSHISLSHAANFLKKKYKANINAYFGYSIIVSKLNENFLTNIKWFLSNLISYKNIGLYKSFGTQKIYKPKISKYQNDKAHKMKAEILNKIKNKSDLLSVKYKSILIGDLIYDTYLNSLKKVTLNLEDSRLHNMISDFLSLCIYWDDYFDNNDTKALLCIHTVYSYAIPARIAISKNINVYAMNMERFFSLSKDNYLKGTDFHYYPEIFKSLKKAEQIEGKLLAKKKLIERFEGKTGTDIDLTYVEVSAFSKNNSKKNVLKKSDNTKILIAPHDFFDSIHVMGDLIFPDFYEWLKFLGEMTEKTSYDWYIKNRPNYPGKFRRYQPLTNTTVESLTKKYPKLTLLDNDISHHQLIAEGINFVFTGFGSIGVEYPYFGIPVVNACKFNPHYRYNFTLSPKNMEEYKETIFNLNKIDFKIDIEEIYEFYFMRHIFHNRKWLTRKHREMVKEIGGYNEQFTNKLYDYWINNFSEKEHKKTENYLNNFINSNDFLLSLKHQNKKN